jgi:hypothetical protein
MLRPWACGGHRLAATTVSAAIPLQCLYNASAMPLQCPCIVSAMSVQCTTPHPTASHAVGAACTHGKTRSRSPRLAWPICMGIPSHAVSLTVTSPRPSHCRVPAAVSAMPLLHPDAALYTRRTCPHLAKVLQPSLSLQDCHLRMGLRRANSMR